MRQELKKRYGNDYRAVCVPTAAEALQHLDQAALSGSEWHCFSPICGFRGRPGPIYSPGSAPEAWAGSVWCDDSHAAGPS